MGQPTKTRHPYQVAIDQEAAARASGDATAARQAQVVKTTLPAGAVLTVGPDEQLLVQGRYDCAGRLILFGRMVSL